MKTQTSPVYFVGKGPVSKSLYLRALIVQSYFPAFQIQINQNDTPCDDVLYMKKALQQLKAWKTKKTVSDQKLIIDCGLSGAVLRFLALRVARGTILSTGTASQTLNPAYLTNQNHSATKAAGPSHFVLTGEKYLFERPLRELISTLGQLSCSAKAMPNSLHIKSAGWQVTGDAITVSIHRSSQFASALLLNSWLLPFDLYLSLEGNPVSSSYLQMTISFLRSLGMQITPLSSPLGAGEGKSHNLSISKEYYIPKGQKISKWSYEPEQDMGCLFALSALTVKSETYPDGGEVIFQDWPEKSLQPDFVFPSLLKKMGFKVLISKGNIKISPGPVIQPITYSMREAPDLFPVLSALCALSTGESRLYGAPHLCYKESHRLQKTAELLTKAGKKVQILTQGVLKGATLEDSPSYKVHKKHEKANKISIKDGLIISGPVPSNKIPAFEFDPARDHRMVMSASVLKKLGLPIRILTPEVVSKSWPNFLHFLN